MSEVDMDEQYNCSVCAYPFSFPNKVPRMLPCRHTFCFQCIHNIIGCNPSGVDICITCPICRDKMPVPPTGAMGFIENYFKVLKKMIATCDVCDAESKSLLGCSTCNGLLCEVCYPLHSHGREEMLELDIFDDTYERLLRLYHRVYQDKLSTLHLANLVTSYRCSTFTQVKKILILSTDECWVLPNHSDVVCYGTNGQEKSRIYFQDKIMDVAMDRKGSLIIAINTGELFRVTRKYDKEKLLNITDTVPAIPSHLYVYEDDRLMVIALNKGTKGNVIVFFDLCKGNNSCVQKEELKELIHIVSVSVNPLTGSRFLCDDEHECVFILKQNGKDKYCGRKMLPRVEISPASLLLPNVGNFAFRPRSVCCDCFGNTLVYDMGTMSIHVINDNAQLQGIVLPADMHTMGFINCISIDQKNHLWVGDRDFGIIRVYNIDECSNILESGQDHRLRDLFSNFQAYLLQSPHSAPSFSSDDLMDNTFFSVEMM